MFEFARPQVGNYATAMMLVAIATVLQALAIRFGGVNLSLILYYPMLAGAAWLTSFLFGILSTVVSGLLVWTLFLSDPAAYTEPLQARLVQLATFMLVGVLVCAAAAMLRHVRLANDIADVASRREAAARRQLEAVLQSLPHGVIATDGKGRVTYLNAAATELAGCSMDDATGRPARDVLRVFDHDGRRVQATPLERALGGAHALSDRHWLHGGAGSAPVPIVEAASPIADADGNIDGAVLLFRDAGAARAPTSRGCSSRSSRHRRTRSSGSTAKAASSAGTRPRSGSSGTTNPRHTGARSKRSSRCAGCNATRWPNRSTQRASRSARSNCCACAATAGAFARWCPHARCAATRAAASRCR